MRLIAKKKWIMTTDSKYPKQPNDGVDFNENNDDGGLFKV